MTKKKRPKSNSILSAVDREKEINNRIKKRLKEYVDRKEKEKND